MSRQLMALAIYLWVLGFSHCGDIGRACDMPTGHFYLIMASLVVAEASPSCKQQVGQFIFYGFLTYF